MGSVFCYLLADMCMYVNCYLSAYVGDRQGCTEGKNPGGNSQQWNLLSVICYLLSVCCREETDRAVQKAKTLEAVANDGICYLSSYICYLSSVWCREETDRAVQKANTLEAAANDGICDLSSDICYLSA